jgi:nucleotide-binding universal stress UspA family protein
LYHRILAALDGSKASELAAGASLSLANLNAGSSIVGCHVCASGLHRTRFSDMEEGLPESYGEKEVKRLRSVHGDLIKDGLQTVAKAYLKPLSEESLKKGISYRSIIPEGRNYVEILNTAKGIGAELLVLGAQGNGSGGGLGSTTERVLLYSRGWDLLIIRRPWDLNSGPIIAGVDGSENSFWALQRSAEIASAFHTQLSAVSVYDPFFHTNLFGNIASRLSNSESSKDMGFDISAQEKVHDEIIDIGLEKLYKQSLAKGVQSIDKFKLDVTSDVLAGKVSEEVQRYVSSNGAGFIVVGRYGLHKEKESLIGSNALKLARLSTANVLVVSAPPSETC